MSFWEGKARGLEIRSGVAREEGLTPKGHTGIWGGDGTVLYLDSGDYMSICQKS